MDPLKARLLELGQKVARSSDESGQAQTTIGKVRERLRAGGVSRPSRISMPVLASLGLAALAIGAVAFAFWQGRTREPLTFTVEARSGTTERALQTNELETKRLHFSDGTTLSLQPSSRVEVHALTASGATVGLLEGRARASVEPDADAHWEFLAGPFFVQVTGTEFDLAWDPVGRVFELALHEGSVEVAGPSLKSKRRVRQGEYVRIALGPEGGARVAERAEAPSGRNEPAPDTRTQAQADVGTPAKVVGPLETAWPELLRSGQRREAFATLDRMGPSAIERASGPELWDLAHAARLGGRPKLAEQALLTLRQRDGVRGQTAFLLGKVAADQLNRAPEAITWFQTYLAEAPQGPLAEQALGRLVELQAGTRAGKRAAKEYLARYPEGAYASFAHSLLR